MAHCRPSFFLPGGFQFSFPFNPLLMWLLLLLCCTLYTVRCCPLFLGNVVVAMRSLNPSISLDHSGCYRLPLALLPFQERIPTREPSSCGEKEPGDDIEAID